LNVKTPPALKNKAGGVFVYQVLLPESDSLFVLFKIVGQIIETVEYHFAVVVKGFVTVGQPLFIMFHEITVDITVLIEEDFHHVLIVLLVELKVVKRGFVVRFSHIEDIFFVCHGLLLLVLRFWFLPFGWLCNMVQPFVQ
jgi:hypothetical protein